MEGKMTRRKLIKSAVAGASGIALSHVAGLEGRVEAVAPEPTATGSAVIDATAGAAPEAAILPLTCTSDVYVPPRGKRFFKFSFDFPEPSVEFEGLRFSFRLFSFENTYAPDRDLMTLTKDSEGVHIRCEGWVWAGGQQKAPGRLEARLRKNGGFVELDASAEINFPIKSIAAIVRGVPHGKISAGGGRFWDPKDDELLFGYPFGGGSLFTAAEIVSPIVVIQSGEREFFFLSALLDQVRATRFYLQPGEKGYRVELIHERQGWSHGHTIKSPLWRFGRTTSVEDAYRPHFDHVERAFRLAEWEKRADVPPWFRDIALVLSIHGMHFTGYVFNDFPKILKTLEWVATQIPARQVLVFVAAWDGRYYWNYPLYKPDERLGGHQGFKTLIDKGHSLGFRFMPMFGTNAANGTFKEFAKFADATTSQIDGDAFNLNWVDWDNDRHYEGWGPYLNVGVDSWRHYLCDRIAEAVKTYQADAYFLDIVGGWENNTKADMHEGTRLLIQDLSKKCPGVLVCGEMSYDAQMSFLPVYHVFPAAGYTQGFQKYCRAFQHISTPAPGRGSSGVHESGFGHFDPKTLALTPNQIPTITIVDDTFEQHQDIMAEIIQRAKERAKT